MVFDYNALVQKLRDFQVRNVRLDESFNVGTKPVKGKQILVSIRGKKLLTACTDERKVKALIDPKSGEEKNLDEYVLARCAGAVFGLIDAVRNVNVTIQREQILQALVENGVVVANHTDTHAAEGQLTGCGQGGLRSLPESSSIFDRPPVPVEERIKSCEEMGVWRVVLEGEHTAEGMVVNSFMDRVLDPNAAEAGNSFFSLDLGIYREILRWVEGALGFGDEALRTMLVKLTRNNLAAVFILTNGSVKETVYIERDDEEDRFFAGVLHAGLAEFKEREGSVMRVLEQRMSG